MSNIKRFPLGSLGVYVNKNHFRIQTRLHKTKRASGSHKAASNYCNFSVVDSVIHKETPSYAVLQECDVLKQVWYHVWLRANASIKD